MVQRGAACRVIQQAGLRGFNPQQPFAGRSAPVEVPDEPETSSTSWDDDSWSEPTRPLPPIPPLPSFDPDRTSTAPIDLPR